MKRFFTIALSLVVCTLLCTGLVACSNNHYKGKTYVLSEVVMYNDNSSENTYEEYIAKTGITEEQMEKIKAYYGIEIKDVPTMKEFLLNYISASIEFGQDDSITFKYGLHTVEDNRLKRSTEYSYGGIYKILEEDNSLSISLYEYKTTHGNIDTNDAGVYERQECTTLYNTPFGDLRFNITGSVNSIKMNFYNTLSDESENVFLSLIFTKA